MVKTLRLVRDATNQVFNLTRNTQLGRGDYERDRWIVRDRPIPDIFPSLEARMVLDGPEITSRNHAGIIQVGEEFFVYDLSSANGTYVNGEAVLPGHPRVLEDGDTLVLHADPAGGRLRRAIRRHSSKRVIPAEFKASYVDLENYALLVGAGSDHVGACEGDVARMGKYLGQRGYSITTLTGNEATKARLKEEFIRLKNLAVTESNVFFSFHGHGGPQGLSIGGQVFNPKDLYTRLNRLRAENIGVLLEACHSGVFLSNHNLEKIGPGISVLTASGERQFAAETVAFGGSHAFQGDEVYSGRLANAFTGHLRASRELVDLQDFYSQIMDPDNEQYATLRSQNPQFYNSGFRLPKPVTQLHSLTC